MSLKNNANAINILCGKIKRLAERQRKIRICATGPTGATGATGVFDPSVLTAFSPQFFLLRDRDNVMVPMDGSTEVPLGGWSLPSGFNYDVGTFVDFTVPAGTVEIIASGFYSIKIVLVNQTIAYTMTPSVPIILAILNVNGGSILTTPLYSLLDPGSNISEFTTTMALDAMLTSGSILNIVLFGASNPGISASVPINAWWSIHRIG